MGLVAHNSFVHAYVELGFLGGSLFLTVFAFSLRNLHSLQEDKKLRTESRLWRLRDLLTGAFAAFAVGFLSLSRCYFVPTYMLFGLATSYFNLIEGKRSQKAETIDQKIAAPLLRHQHGRLDCPASVPEAHSLRVEHSGTNNHANPRGHEPLSESVPTPSAPPSTGRSSGRWRNCTHWP